MKDDPKVEPDELRPKYDVDYSKAVRGKPLNRLVAEDVNVVFLDPDIAKFFPDSVSANEARRSLLELTRAPQRITREAAEKTEWTLF